MKKFNTYYSEAKKLNSGKHLHRIEAIALRNMVKDMRKAMLDMKEEIEQLKNKTIKKVDLELQSVSLVGSGLRCYPLLSEFDQSKNIGHIMIDESYEKEIEQKPHLFYIQPSFYSDTKKIDSFSLVAHRLGGGGGGGGGCGDFKLKNITGTFEDFLNNPRVGTFDGPVDKQDLNRFDRFEWEYIPLSNGQVYMDKKYK